MKNSRFLLPVLVPGLLSTVIFSTLPGFGSEGPRPERVALVIGNDHYDFGTPLENAVADSRLIAKTLRGIGFEVIHAEDAGIDEFYAALERFKLRAGMAEIGLFYFAGHAIELDNRNYLLPSNAKLEASSQPPPVLPGPAWADRRDPRRPSEAAPPLHGKGALAVVRSRRGRLLPVPLPPCGRSATGLDIPNSNVADRSSLLGWADSH
jgi:hypothetical protein